MFKSLALGASALILTTTPVVASAAPAANSLSVSNAARAGSPAVKANRLSGAGIGPIAAAAIAAGVAVIAVIVIDDQEDESDSN